MSCCRPANRSDPATRASMCAACPHRRGELCRPAGTEAVTLLVGGECPRGRWPDKRGVVRWLGVEWYGVPMPLRWWLMLTGRSRAMDPEAWPMCGCMVRLKAWVDRVYKSTPAAP